jgi:WD40 repeat protein
MEWSPDGAWLAASCTANTMLVWPAEGTDPSTLRGHRSAITAIAWSADAKLLASGSRDRTVRIWRPDGELVAEIDNQGKEPSVLAWSPKTGQLAWSSSGTTQIRLCQPDGAPIDAVLDPKVAVQALAWSPDGQFLAIGGVRDNNACAILLRREDRAQVVLKGISEAVCTLAWSADSKRLASASASGNIEIHEASGTMAASCPGNGHRLRGMRWSEDGQHLRSIAADGTVKLRNTSSGEIIETSLIAASNGRVMTFGPGGQPLSKSLDDAGEFLVVGERADGSMSLHAVREFFESVESSTAQ